MLNFTHLLGKKRNSLEQEGSPTNASSPDSPVARSSPWVGRIPASTLGLPKRDFDDSGVAGSLSAPISQDESVIIFDWDDTLCPTFWITRVMSCGLNHIELDDRNINDPKLITVLKAKKDLASPDSKFRAQLQAHSRIVEAVLRTARSLGQVRIVTLGSQPWFEYSAVFFAGLDIPALLKELDIEVYFATYPQNLPEGMNVKVAAKTNVMAECLTKHYGIASVRWNTFSIGDQPEERDALKLCCESCPHRRKKRPICKSLLLDTEPMLQDLTDSLERLAPALPRLVSHDRDADWTLDTARC